MKTKDFGHKAEEDAYCPGYTDAHGHWNNGFHCPMWADPGRDYCCGTENQRYCCVDEPETEGSNPAKHVNSPVPLFVGLGVSLAVLCLAAVALSCMCFSCCPWYKRRKQRRYREYERRNGHEMNSYLSNEFVYIPNQGTFRPAILEGCDTSSGQGILLKDELRGIDVYYNVNEAYSISNISTMTQQQRHNSMRSSSQETSLPENQIPLCVAETGSLYRDSGCYLLPGDADHNNVGSSRSSVATLEQERNVSNPAIDSQEQVMEPDTSHSGLLHDLENLENISACTSSDEEEFGQFKTLSDEPSCCERNATPHMHSKV